MLFTANPALIPRDKELAILRTAWLCGAPIAWGASFSEVAGDSAPPRRETLAWYRLACFLPPVLPTAANLSESAEDRAQAEIDYRLVIAGLGPCPRTRR